MKATGWAEYPDRLARLTEAIERGWKRVNPARVDRKQLAMIGRHVAPDEAQAFADRSKAYLRSVDEPQYLRSLRRWLEEWRDYDQAAAPMSRAEMNQYWTTKLPNGADLARQEAAAR